MLPGQRGWEKRQQGHGAKMKAEAAEILRWYDRHARDLPWRVPPGADRAANPYHVWLSEIMLQQTTVAAVKAYFMRFTTTWPRVEDLAAADDADVMAAWAGLGYYARARNLLKAARLVVDLGGFPDTEEGLRALPGVGPYTSAAIAAIAFGHRAVVVDGNVERVMARYFALHDPLPGVKPEMRARADDLTPQDRAGDYAQAVMDLGATICTPRNPACGLCPWREGCKARREGAAEELPKRAPKAEKPTRYGMAYYGIRADGAVLLERRPGRGLLGGMLGFPGTDWSEHPPETKAPCAADWRILPDPVTHVFTHFRLELTVSVAKLDIEASPEQGDFMAPHAFSDAALPTVFRKVYRAAHPALADQPA